MNHTKGLWKADGRLVVSGRTRIAEAFERSFIGACPFDLPAQENAQLISAAPEMLEALEKALDIMGRIQEISKSPNITTLLQELDEYIYPAVAKAKGK